MLTLFQFPPMWGLPNVSPFCLKLETYLRLAGIPYTVKPIINVSKAPKGKVPFIEDNGQIIADSGFIIDYLKRQYGDPLDGHLNDFRRAQGLALQRLIEEHMYWTALYSRWIDEANWSVLKKTFFQRVPGLMRSFVANRVQKKLWSQLNGQGIGRHTKDEIYKLGLDDLRALKAILTDQPFLLGDVVTSVDASGYAFLTNIIDVPVESPLKDYAASLQCFRDYCDRVKELAGF